MRPLIPKGHHDPTIAGREEALTKLGIPSPTPHQLGKMFPNLVDVSIQLSRGQGWGGNVQAMNAVARQGGISRMQMMNMEGNEGVG